MNIPIMLLVIFVLAAVLPVYFSQSKPRGDLWFGVTLPRKALKDKRLLQLQTQYRRTYYIFGAAILIAALPLLLLSNMPLLAYLYLLFWVIGAFYTSSILFRRYHYSASKLKREKNWFGESKREISIEPEIGRLSAMKPISPYWFLLPAFISCALIIVSAVGSEGLLRLTGLASFIMTVVMFLLYRVFSKGRSRPDSGSAANAALHSAARRYWSVMWLALALFEAVNAFIAYAVLRDGLSSDFSIWMGGIMMVSLIPLVVIIAVNNKIRGLEYRYADTNGKAYLGDDDEFWRHGLVYYNPDDASMLVRKRIGIGSTVNMATRGGKLLVYGGAALAAAILIPVLLLLARGDAVAPSLIINEDGTASIVNTEYPYSFSLEDMLEVKLEDQLPSGFRSNGVATSLYARGNFSLNELGDAKLYVFKKSPPFIVIKLPDLYVVFNEDQAAATTELYNELAAFKESPPE
ncbi:DUF5808 domain-containing protein [Paenibacillus sp. CAU 1782]